MAIRKRYRKAQDAKAVAPQVHARITGSLEFLCPRCGKMKQFSRINVRDPRWQCRGCRRVWVFGLGFTDRVDPGTTPPFHAVWFNVPLPGGLVNLATLDFSNPLASALPAPAPAIARVTGNVEFWCPSCGEHNRQAPSFHTSAVECEGCRVEFYIVPLLHSSVPGAHRATPIDWISPYASSVRELGKRSSSAAVDSSRGESQRDRTGTVAA